MKKSPNLARANHSKILMEALEPRAYFDLVPSFSGAIPTDLVAAVKNNSTVTVDLTSSTAAAKGPYTLTLFASTSPVFGAATDTQISSVNKSASLSAGQSTPVKFKLTDFPEVANGSYYLLAEVTGSLTGGSDNVAASATPIVVTDPFIDLTDSVSIVSPANAQVLPGKPVGLSIEVFNGGNVPAAGALLTDLGLQTAGLVSDGIVRPLVFSSVTPVGTSTSHIHIAPGGHEFIHVSEKVPVGFTPGQYVWNVAVDPNNTFNESNTTNNSADSSTLTVLDPYPDLLGTFSGPDKITHGPSKGVTVTIALDFTSESQTTGALVAKGSLFAVGTSNFNFSGTITPKGVFIGIGSSSTSVFTATYKGKLVGHTITGSVKNTDGNSGTFTLTLSV